MRSFLRSSAVATGREHVVPTHTVAAGCTAVFAITTLRGRGRRVLNRLRRRREVGGAAAVPGDVEEPAGRIVPVDAATMVRDREGAGEPGGVSRRLVGVEERGSRLNVVVQQALRLRPTDHVG